MRFPFPEDFLFGAACQVKSGCNKGYRQVIAQKEVE